MSDRRDAIGFFDPQLVGVADDGCAVGQRAGHGQDRQFVNQLRNFFAMNHGALKRHTRDFDDAARFYLIDIFNRFAHLRAHSNQNAERRRPRVVQSNVAHEEMAARLRSCCD